MLVHDGARPCLDISILDRGWDNVKRHGAAVAGVPVKDTIKVASLEGEVQQTPPRESLWAAQTPQGFSVPELRAGHVKALKNKWSVTDDASLYERLGWPVQVLE